MKTENWRIVKELVAEALSLEQSERSKFLDQPGIGDEIRVEVESLLAFEEEAEHLMNLSAVEFSKDFFDADEAADASLIGQYFGNYQIIREIGHGGMGAVYLAERRDGKFRQKVALKLLRREVNTAALRRRFRQEREILASLEHPNITRLLDAGTTDDKIPFIAMEFVEGLPINEYCDRKNLDLNERLRLFQTVCSVVDFAHRNLVVHRDLKPSNILVNQDGIPKLLDFGISKILISESENENAATITRFGMMTPAYASPEQLQKKSVTTATDVYSLGVILFELLSGHRPFEKKEDNVREIYQAVLETDPPPPSALIVNESKTSAPDWNRENEAAPTKISEKFSPDEIGDDLPEKANIFDLPTIISSAETPTTGNVENFQTVPSRMHRTAASPVRIKPQSLRGDLDNIVLKALKKEPGRRYSSAENFSDDIKRHLDGLPVAARPDTFSYRAEKFIRRNRVFVAAGALLLLVIIGGVIATLWQARIAEAERVKAERHFNDVRALANSFLFEFSPQIENLSGSTPARELLVRRALEYLDNLSAEASDDLELQSELAKAYEKVGNVQGNPDNANLGDLKGALESYRKALNIRQNLSEKQPADLTAQIDLARNFKLLGDIQGQTGEKSEGLASQETALGMSRRIVELDQQNFAARENLAAVTRSRGMSDFWSGKNPPAIEYFEQSKAIYERLLNEKPGSPPLLQSLAGLYMNIGEAQAWNDDFENSGNNIQKGLEMMLPLAEKYPYDNSMQRTLMVAYLKRATNFQMNEEHEKATQMFTKGLEIAEILSKADPQNLQANKDVAQLGAYLGASLDLSGKSAESLKMFEFAIGKYQEIRDSHPDDVNAAYNVASTRFAYGETYETLEDYHSALKIFETVRNELQAILARDPNYGNAIRDNAFINNSIGKSYANLAEKENQLEFLQKALENQRAALEKFGQMESKGMLNEFDRKEVAQTEGEVKQLADKIGK